METLLHIGLGNALAAGVLAVLAGGVTYACRRPALSHSLWLLVLLKLLMPPFLFFPVSWPGPEASEATPSAPAAESWAASSQSAAAGPVVMPAPQGTPGHPPPLNAHAGAERSVIRKPEPLLNPAPPTTENLPWRPALVLLWLAGCLVWWAVAGWRIARFQRWLRSARPAPPALQEQAQQLARRLGLAHCPCIGLISAPVSPLLWALGKTPHLLLPAGLWERLGPDQQLTLLAHELAHLRRRDHWVRRLELVVAGLYWWHPVVWWAMHQLREAEEQCCDAWVVWALPEAAGAYATALVETVAFLSRTRSPLPVTASGIGHVQSLKRRLTMILRGTPPRALSGAGLLAVLGLGALLLPLLPSRAETPATPDDPPPVVRHSEDQPPPKKGLTKPVLVRKMQTEPVIDDPAKARSRTRADGLKKAELIEDLKDEIQILEVQLEAKRAQLKATQIVLNHAQVTATKLERAFKQGSVPEEPYLKARETMAKLEADLLVKHAELKEPEVRLKQARRKLARLEGNGSSSRDTAEAAQPAGLFKERVKDFGTVKRGTPLLHRFQLTNNTRQLFHIAGIRVSAGFLTAKATRAEVKPSETTEIVVWVDTKRFTGSKTATVFVTFDKPQPAEVGLLVRADSQENAQEKPADRNQRLRELEKKLQELQKEVDTLRRQMGPKQGDLQENKGTVRLIFNQGVDGEHISHQRSFRIPFLLDPASAARVTRLALVCSQDEGRTWRTVGQATPDKKVFTFVAPSDGSYWFAVFTLDADKKVNPPLGSKPTPLLKVRVRSSNQGY
jgi:beta-lactamase regulating signal transducer with metallopeptidase domain